MLLNMFQDNGINSTSDEYLKQVDAECLISDNRDKGYCHVPRIKH